MMKKEQLLKSIEDCTEALRKLYSISGFGQNALEGIEKTIRERRFYFQDQLRDLEKEPEIKRLNEQTQTFDRAVMFKVEGVISACSLHKYYDEQGNAVFWAMQSGAMIKSHYTEEDIKHSERMRNLEPINNGEIVIIEGRKYKTVIKGNYSDCAIFEPIEETTGA